MRLPWWFFGAVGFIACGCASTAVWAQFGQTEVTRGPRLGDPLVQELQVGVVVSGDSGPCRGIVATTPVPIDWPEQTVRIAGEDVSPSVKKVGYRMVGDTVKQMLIDIPYVGGGEEVKVLVNFEISRSALAPPEDTSIFVLPERRKIPRDVIGYLGPSPYIESTHTRVKALARELMVKDLPAWRQVEAVYDWVREHVDYKEGPIKGAAQALADGYGDCEELTSLFIAICRAGGVPARMVWVPGHCYPEFYLEDGEGVGYWFPCQAAGTREFGGITEHRPILQKGDNFRVPERPRDRQRYVAEFLTGAGGKPKVRFVRDLVGESGARTSVPSAFN